MNQASLIFDINEFLRPGEVLGSLLTACGINRVEATYRIPGEVENISFYAGDTKVENIDASLVNKLRGYIWRQRTPLSLEGTITLTVSPWGTVDKPTRSKKDVVLERLRAEGITSVKVEYDGGGDEGAVNEVVAYKGDDAFAIGDDLKETLDEFAWDCVSVEHEGFWNNEGGYGEVDILVDAGTVTVSHNDYVTETVFSMTSI